MEEKSELFRVIEQKLLFMMLKIFTVQRGNLQFLKLCIYQVNMYLTLFILTCG